LLLHYFLEGNYLTTKRDFENVAGIAIARLPTPWFRA